MCASAPMVGALTYVMPLSNSFNARNARFTLLVYSDDDRPYFTPLLTRNASSASATLITLNTGPKISSCSIRSPCFTPAKIVG